MLAKVLGIEAQLPPKAIDAKKKKTFFFNCVKCLVEKVSGFALSRVSLN